MLAIKRKEKKLEQGTFVTYKGKVYEVVNAREIPAHYSYDLKQVASEQVISGATKGMLEPENGAINWTTQETEND